MSEIEKLRKDALKFIEEERTVSVKTHGHMKKYKIIDYVGHGEFQAQLQNVNREEDIIYIGLPGVIKAIKEDDILGYG